MIDMKGVTQLKIVRQAAVYTIGVRVRYDRISVFEQ